MRPVEPRISGKEIQASICFSNSPQAFLMVFRTRRKLIG